MILLNNKIERSFSSSAGEFLEEFMEDLEQKCREAVRKGIQLELNPSEILIKLESLKILEESNHTNGKKKTRANNVKKRFINRVLKYVERIVENNNSNQMDYVEAKGKAFILKNYSQYRGILQKFTKNQLKRDPNKKNNFYAHNIDKKLEFLFSKIKFQPLNELICITNEIDGNDAISSAYNISEMQTINNDEYSGSGMETINNDEYNGNGMETINNDEYNGSGMETINNDEYSGSGMEMVPGNHKFHMSFSAFLREIDVLDYLRNKMKKKKGNKEKNDKTSREEKEDWKIIESFINNI